MEIGTEDQVFTQLHKFPVVKCIAPSDGVSETKGHLQFLTVLRLQFSEKYKIRSETSYWMQKCSLLTAGQNSWWAWGVARSKQKLTTDQKRENLKLVSTYASLLIIWCGSQQSDVIKIFLKPNYWDCTKCSLGYPFLNLGLDRESKLELLFKTACVWATGHKALIGII